jgi:hypothetical protein
MHAALGEDLRASYGVLSLDRIVLAEECGKRSVGS